MTSDEVLARLADLLKGDRGFPELKDALYDGDNDSGELVLVTEDASDGHQEWIVSSNHVRRLE